MAVRLRLKRTGKKKQPSYRVVAVDSRKPRDGRVLEVIGTYDPRQEPSAISIVNERAVHWLSHGAQPSETVSKLLTISGAWDDFRSGSDPQAAVADAEPSPDVAPAAPVPDLVLDAPAEGDDPSPADPSPSDTAPEGATAVDAEPQDDGEDR
ncbi:30S ribosomal protein S16 [Candidatus Poriferisodalis sp.]|uniref:30S ribosomal protein S16 n=1 Tax=Candidatus Poriferisodalis sp. TaxID=3101277 RepID=UPI003B02C8AA